ncbi:hypothetical protein Pint_12628 [Pistacia integerrima]|uniref:Uncharacterized protein n=1 Tax=Pistacia integerrima TaxID=434235 RepID=A0ACC0Y9E2_9ROSI|nr:hypothetical protein Pint_12628 [Pistacia integerrima]
MAISLFNESDVVHAEAATGNNVFVAAGDVNAEEDNKKLINDVELPPYVEGACPRITTTIYENKNDRCYSSDGSPLSMSREEGNNNSSEFMMLDFNVEDLGIILDSDFTNKFNEMEKTCDEASIFPKKIKEKNGRGDQSGTTTTTTTTDQDQFLSLAFSFLESAEEWPGDDLNNNITHGFGDLEGDVDGAKGGGAWEGFSEEVGENCVGKRRSLRKNLIERVVVVGPGRNSLKTHQLKEVQWSVIGGVVR